MEQNVETFDKLWDYGNPGQTEEQFRALLPESQSDPDFYLQLLTQIARTQGLQGKFDDAHTTLDEVHSSLSSGEELHPRTQVRYLLERGRVFNSSGNRDAARPLFLQAYRFGVDTNEDFHAVDAAHMMAIVQEDSDESLTWNREAMEFAERSKDEKAGRWLGSLYNNIGVTYLDRKEYQNALDTFQKGLEWRREYQNSPLPLRIARWCVARAQRGLGNFEEALRMQRELEAEWAAAGTPSGYVFEEIAECLSALKQESLARPYFAQAYDILSKDNWLVENESERIERLRLMGAKAEKATAASGSNSVE